MGVKEFKTNSKIVFRVYILTLISQNMFLVVLPRKGIDVRIEQ